MDRIIDLNQIRTLIINQAFIVFAILGLPTIIIGTIRGMSYRYDSVNTIEIGIYICVLIIVGFRKKLSVNLKVSTYIIITLSYIVLEISKYGFLASAKLFIVIIPIVISFLVSYRSSIAILGIYIGVYIIFAFLYTNKTLNYNFDTTNYLTDSQVWTLDIVVATFSALGLLYIGNIYRKVLLSASEVIKEGEIHIEEKEFNYQAIFEHSNDAIIIINNDFSGKCNKKTFELFNCSPDYIVGKTLADYSPEYQPDGKSSDIKAKDLITKTLKGENVFEEWQHKKPNNELLDVILSTSIITINNQRVVQVILRDISEQKRANLELKQYRNFLKDQVEERTNELEKANNELKISNNKLQQQSAEVNKTLNNLYSTQNKLIESEKMASIGILTAGVAHEINNPLNFIKTGLYSIETTLENPEYFTNTEELRSTQKEIINNIEEGINRIANIIKSLHHFNRSSESTFNKCNISVILDNCINALEKDLSKAINIVRDYTFDDLTVIGNEGKLHHLFLQIISNAIQAFKNDGVINVSAQLSNTKKNITIIISDNGIGIPKELLKRVFDPFFTTKEAGLGTGLGLSISYEIIKEHQGEIDIKSDENIGTTITIDLPVNNQCHE